MYKEDVFIKNNLTATSAPGVSDDESVGFEIGSKWVNVSTETIYFCVKQTAGAAVWSEVGLPSLSNGNGTTANGNAVDLGGTLTNGTNILGNNQQLQLGTLASTLGDFRVQSVTGNHLYQSGGLIASDTWTPVQAKRRITDGTHESFIDAVINQIDLYVENAITNEIGRIYVNNNEVRSEYDDGGSVVARLALASAATTLLHVDGANSMTLQAFNTGMNITYSDGANSSLLDLTPTTAQIGQGTNILEISQTSHTFTDNTALPAGLEYASDYSTNYSPRSLVDKAYVDLQVSSGTGIYGGSGAMQGNAIVDGNQNILRFGDYAGDDVLTNRLSRYELATVDSLEMYGNYAPAGAGSISYRRFGNHTSKYGDISNVDFDAATPTEDVEAVTAIYSEGSMGRTDRVFFSNEDSDPNSFAEFLQSGNQINLDTFFLSGAIDFSSTVRTTTTDISLLNSMDFGSGAAIASLNLANGVSTLASDGGTLQISNGANGNTFTDVTTGLEGIHLLGYGESDNTDSGATANYSTLVNTSLVPKRYVDDKFETPVETRARFIGEGTSTAAAQNPTGTGEANGIQVEFGPGFSTTEVTLASDGTLTFNEDGLYHIEIALQFGRTGGGGVSQLYGRALVNGSQVTCSIEAELDNADVIINRASSTFLPSQAGDTFAIELIRDSSGNDSGGLLKDDPTAATAPNWGPGCTAQITVRKIENIGNAIGVPSNDPDAIHVNVAGEIFGITEKATPVAGDWIVIEDSADSNNKKKVQIGNLPGGGGGTTILTATEPVVEASWSGNTNYVYNVNVAGAVAGDFCIVRPNEAIYASIQAGGTEFNGYAYCNAANNVVCVMRVSSFIGIGPLNDFTVKVIK